ncbi:PASTA domain-containing protein [Streptomyces sp. URMC 123]|uniref:PASTA domain-containing protein n=1 Tax=Streptomyces sp. URMC 123 TaxID=3423403 RepID=UPI003F1B5F3C
MRNRYIAAAPLAAALLLMSTACGDTGSSSPAGKGTGASSAPADGQGQAGQGSGKAGRLPDLVGKGLQAAQDTAQDSDFLHLTSHDALGRGRNQILDRQWKVCFQTPAPGSHPITTKVDLGAVKLDETCPDRDAGGQGSQERKEAGGTMPDVTGKSVKAVRQSLDSGASLQVEDATGNRNVLIESNWKVCAQTPAPGTKLTGQPVALKAVKFEESCP